MEMARQVISVLAVFALLGAMLWMLRNGGFARFRGFGVKARVRQLESVERLVLTANHSLHLIRIGGKEVVVATHPQGCALLVEHPANGGPQ
jgi:flagellar biogenesis protein FliO